MRTITCPHCGFSRDIPPEAIPEGASAVNCPTCGKRFPFRKEPEMPEFSAGASLSDTPGGDDFPAEDAGFPFGDDDLPEEESEEPPPRADDDEEDRIVCPVCSTGQKPTESCVNCGLIFAKWEEVRNEGEDFYLADTGELLRSEEDGNYRDALDVLPRAGFWLRATAALADMTIIALGQFFFGLLLTGVAMFASWGWQLGPDGLQSLMVPVKLFNIALFLTYFIVFTGYGGQTPGKMLLRLKVIRSDGGEIGYARAFIREAPGKLISAITFGIGFFMIGFQPDKRGLHDLLSGSCVVKLR